MKQTFICPCGSGKNYKQCCQPLHDGTFPENALALMRSRYSAYALKLPQYIIKTTHAGNPYYKPNHTLWAKEILAYCQNTEFVELKILEFVDGPAEAYVTFEAYLKQGPLKTIQKEKSRFEKVNGQWLYLEGIVERTQAK